MLKQHCYNIMRLSVVSPNRIGCMQVCVVKGNQKGSGLLLSPQPLYPIPKKKMAIYIKSTILKLETRDVCKTLTSCPF